MRHRLNYCSAVCIYLLLCLAAHTSVAQIFQYPHTRFTTRDGLSQLKVLSLFEDSRGYIWIGTHRGLNRFDGQQFKAYDTQDGIAGEPILDITEGPNGRIYFSTTSKLVILDGIKAATVELPEATAKGSLLFDAEDRLWVYCRSNGIYIYDGANFNPLSERYPGLKGKTFEDIVRIPGSSAVSLFEYPRGWWMIRPGESAADSVAFSPFSKGGTIGNDIYANAFDHPNELIFSVRTDDGAARWYRSSTDEWQNRAARYSKGELEAQSPDMPRFFPIRLPGNETVLYVREGARNYKRSPELDFKNIRAVLQSGHKWYFGTNEGLIRIIDNGWKVMTQPACASPWSIAKTPEGEYLMACMRDGLIRLSDGKKHRIPPSDINESIFLPGKAAGPDGTIVFGANRGLVAWKDGALQRIAQRRHAVEAVYYDIDGRSFVFADPDSVCLLDYPHTDKPNCFALPAAIQSQTPPTCIAQSSRDSRWIGGAEGLVRWFSRQDSFAVYAPENGALPCFTVESVVIDSTGRIWAGCAEGLFLKQVGRDSFIQMHSDLITGSVNQLALLPESRLFAATDHESFILDLAHARTPIIRQFDASSGYICMDPAQNGAFYDDAGYLWVPSGTAVQRLDLSRLGAQAQPLRLRLESVNGYELSLDRRDSVIVLERGSREVALKASTPGITELKPLFQFSSDGKNWSAPQSQPAYTFNNIGHGTHTFWVKALAHSGDAEKAAVSKAIVFNHLPLLQRPFVIPLLMGLALFGLLLWLWYFFRERRARLRWRRALEHNRLLQIQTLQSQMNPHFIFNALTTVQNSVHNREPEEASRMLVRLAAMMRQFLEARKDSASDRPDLIPLDEDLAFLDSYVAFEQMQAPHDFRYQKEIDPDIEPSAYFIPPLLLQPFLENAIKHGLAYRDAAGELRMALRQNSDYLLILIEDDGVGRKRAREIQSASGKIYRSRGTGLVKKRIELLGRLGYEITLKIEDRPGGGTIVTLKLPKHRRK